VLYFIHAICQFRISLLNFRQADIRNQRFIFKNDLKASFYFIVFPNSFASHCWIERFHQRQSLSDLSGFFIFLWSNFVTIIFWKKWTTLTWRCVSASCRCSCGRCCGRRRRCCRSCCCWGCFEGSGGVYESLTINHHFISWVINFDYDSLFNYDSYPYYKHLDRFCDDVQTA